LLFLGGDGGEVPMKPVRAAWWAHREHMQHVLPGCTISSFLLLLLALPGGCSSASTSSTCTLTPPAQDDYCTAMADYLGRCGHCHDCTEQNLQTCAKRESADGRTSAGEDLLLQRVQLHEPERLHELLQQRRAWL
jgi:hypothetical protein